MKISLRLLARYLPLIALAMLLPAASIAQPVAASSFEPTSSDLSRWIIITIFGDWTAGQKIPLLGATMEVLNNFALTFGTLMFTYVTVVGTMNTAQDGELLGKKWSSMWLPLRYLGGTALLLPLSTGYSTAQHAVLWLAMMGSGAASAVWGEAVGNFSGNQATSIIRSAEYDGQVQMLVRDILKAEVCVARRQADLPAGSPTNLYGISDEPTPTGVLAFASRNAVRRVVVWGAKNSTNGDSPSVCGKATTTRLEQSVLGGSFNVASANSLRSDGATVQVGGAGSVGFFQNVKDLVTDSPVVQEARAAGTQMIEAQRNAIWLAAEQLRPLAVSMAADPTQVSKERIAKEIARAAATFRGATEPSTAKAVQALDKRLNLFTEAAKDSGWLLASSSFFQMAQIRSSAKRLLDQKPTIEGVPSASGSSALDSIERSASSADIEALATRIDASFKGDATDWGNPGEWAAQKLGYLIAVDPKDSRHALVQIKDAGDKLITTVETIAAGAALVSAADPGGAKIASAVASKLPFVGKAFGAVADFLPPAVFGALVASFAAGITMAFILPMLPFTMMVGSIVGWLMALFSAIVATPIWIAGHLHPEGDDIAGKGIGGYMILLETVTRPIFIIFGLIGAFLIMDPVIKLVALLFQATMSSNEGNSTTGAAAIMTMAILYVTICFTIVRTTTSLIWVLSETVYRWIGGAHAGMEQAREFTTHAENAAKSGADQARHIVSGAAAAQAYKRRGPNG